jgi:AcrR family transcriptional regulator
MRRMAPRKYEQRRRAEAAGETRRRILDAVYDRLREAPSEPVSVDHIARQACVARPTVYLVFGSRAGLFDAVGADLLERGGFARVLEPAYASDARDSLRRGIRGVVEMYAAHRDVLRVLTSMALLDAAAVGGAVQRMEEGRSCGMTGLAQRLADQGLLLPEVSKGQAADLLWLLTSFDSFDLLYTGKARPADSVALTLITTAERSLCRGDDGDAPESGGADAARP